MKLHRIYALGFLALAALPLLFCEDLSTGQLPAESGPPRLVKLLIQDELPSGGRNLATDLLDKTPPVKCSTTEPCPAGDKFSHPLCNPDLGLCPNPLNPAETPPPIGTPGLLGGNQIRFVLNKQLTPDIEMVKTDPKTGAATGYELTDPSIIGIYDSGGHELASLKYWDPTGSPEVTSDVFINPFGPALVLKPKASFIPLTMYSLRLKPDQIKDSAGQALTLDLHDQPVATQYDFTTEAFCPAGSSAEVLRDTQLGRDGSIEIGVIDTKDVLIIGTNVRFDPNTLMVTVKKGGTVVETTASPNFGNMPKQCDSVRVSPTQIAIFRTTGENRTDWEEGEYAVSIDAVSIDNRKATFSLNGLGKSPYRDVPFVAKAGVDKDHDFYADKFLLPSECAASGPQDMGPPPDLFGIAPPDMAMPPIDMAVPSLDMAVTLDGGNGG